MESLSSSTSEARFRPATEADFLRIAPLWQELYSHQKANGMLLTMPPDAYEKWQDSFKPLLGRFACLFLTEIEGRPVGFLAGRIRSMPPYFGGEPTGFISEVFVTDHYRSRGIGRELMNAAMRWFQDHKVTRLELQVIASNHRARQLYEQLGWKAELLQMVWENKQ